MSDGRVPEREVNANGSTPLVPIKEQVAGAWEGPLPPPTVLAQYEQILPGLAHRIVSMVETTTVGAIKIDGKLADAEIEQAKTGQSMAFVVTSVAILATIALFASGVVVPGGLLLPFPVILLVRSFLLRR